MSKQNRSYTDEFKKEAIALAMDSPSVVSAAKSLGIKKLGLAATKQ
jgi:transposase-like protein